LAASSAGVRTSVVISPLDRQELMNILKGGRIRALQAQRCASWHLPHWRLITARLAAMTTVPGTSRAWTKPGSEKLPAAKRGRDLGHVTSAQAAA
jgi:hypothetical protein